MATYGEIIRQIRLGKGYRQKEIYTDIVSKTYAIEFEKGKHQMSISNFEKVLDRLNLTYNEFKFIQQGYQNPTLPSYYQTFMDASNNSDLVTLNKLLITLAGQKGHDIRLLVAQIRLNMLRIEAEERTSQIDFPLSETKIISDFLLRVESWTLEEISLFANNINYLPYEVTKVLMTSANKNLRQYKAFQTYSDTIAGLLINFISAALANQDLATAGQTLILLKESSQSFFDSWQREVYLFLEGIYLINLGQVNLGEKEARQMIQHLKRLEQLQRAEEWETLLAIHLSQHRE